MSGTVDFSVHTTSPFVGQFGATMPGTPSTKPDPVDELRLALALAAIDFVAAAKDMTGSDPKSAALLLSAASAAYDVLAH